MTRMLISCAVFAGAAVLLIPSGSVASDLSGDWTYEVSDSWKRGPCPVGKGGSGEIKITQEGEKVTLVFVSGRKCRPESMCTFEGKLTGDRLVVSNSAEVDDEGGEAKNEISLTLSSANAASGTSESSYSHPGGMECRWGSKITLKR